MLFYLLYFYCFVLLLLSIILSVLRFTASVSYPFGISKPFLQNERGGSLQKRKTDEQWPFCNSLMVKDPEVFFCF